MDFLIIVKQIASWFLSKKRSTSANGIYFQLCEKEQLHQSLFQQNSTNTSDRNTMNNYIPQLINIPPLFLCFHFVFRNVLLFLCHTETDLMKSCVVVTRKERRFGEWLWQVGMGRYHIFADVPISNSANMPILSIPILLGKAATFFDCRYRCCRYWKMCWYDDIPTDKHIVR